MTNNIFKNTIKNNLYKRKRVLLKLLMILSIIFCSFTTAFGMSEVHADEEKASEDIYDALSMSVNILGQEVDNDAYWILSGNTLTTKGANRTNYNVFYDSEKNILYLKDFIYEGQGVYDEYENLSYVIYLNTHSDTKIIYEGNNEISLNTSCEKDSTLAAAIYSASGDLLIKQASTNSSFLSIESNILNYEAENSTAEHAGVCSKYNLIFEGCFYVDITAAHYPLLTGGLVITDFDSLHLKSLDDLKGRAVKLTDGKIEVKYSKNISDYKTLFKSGSNEETAKEFSKINMESFEKPYLSLEVYSCAEFSNFLFPIVGGMLDTEIDSPSSWIDEFEVEWYIIDEDEALPIDAKALRVEKGENYKVVISATTKKDYELSHSKVMAIINNSEEFAAVNRDGKLEFSMEFGPMTDFTGSMKNDISYDKNSNENILLPMNLADTNYLPKYIMIDGKIIPDNNIMIEKMEIDASYASRLLTGDHVLGVCFCDDEGKITGNYQVKLQVTNSGSQDYIWRFIAVALVVALVVLASYITKKRKKS